MREARSPSSGSTRKTAETDDFPAVSSEDLTLRLTSTSLAVDMMKRSPGQPPLASMRGSPLTQSQGVALAASRLSPTRSPFGALTRSGDVDEGRRDLLVIRQQLATVCETAAGQVSERWIEIAANKAVHSLSGILKRENEAIEIRGRHKRRAVVDRIVVDRYVAPAGCLHRDDALGQGVLVVGRQQRELHLETLRYRPDTVGKLVASGGGRLHQAQHDLHEIRDGRIQAVDRLIDDRVNAAIPSLQSSNRLLATGSASVTSVKSWLSCFSRTLQRAKTLAILVLNN